MRLKSIATSAILTVTALGSPLVAAGSASAATCQSLQACLYFNSGLANGSYSHWSADSTFLGDFFSGGAGVPGVGEKVNDNAASVKNNNFAFRYRTWQHYDYAGNNQTVEPSSWENYGSLIQNKNSSGKFLD